MNTQEIQQHLHYIFKKLAYDFDCNIIFADIIINSYIAGGSIYSLYNNEIVNDYDIFCKSKAVAERVSNFIIKNKKSFEEKGYKVSKTNFAVTLKNKDVIYQLITKYYGEPIDVISQFDFKHNMCYYDYINNKIHILSDEKYLSSKYLHFNDERCRDLMQSILRIPKFQKRGFILTKRELSKMLLKLYETGFDDKEVELIKNRMSY